MAEEKKQKGITVTKDEDFSEWYTQVVQKAELADIRFGIQGFIVHRPWGFMIIRKIYEYLEKEVENQGHVPYLFPVAIKEENLTKEAEHAGFTPEVFWVTEAGDKKMEERFALRPTGEAQIYPVYSLWFRSHNELPFKAYQSRHSVYRNEMTTRPFLRGREFLFFESHNVFMTHKEVLNQIEEDLGTCKKIIHDKIKIPFLYFKRPSWDKFKGADNTYTPDTLMPDGKRNQLASTHDLGKNFSKAYDIKVKGNDEKEHYVHQTCFGPGIWRIMAALIGIHGDNKGLIIPFDMAPIQIVIIPITFTKNKKDSDKVIKKCRDLKKKLKSLGYKVKFDDSEWTPGFKYNQWELKGVPLRIEVGPKEIKENSVSLAIRTEQGRKKVKTASLDKEIIRASKKLDKQIEERADEYFKNRTKNANSLDELKDLIKNHKGFIRVPFCSVEKDGEECAEVIKTETEGGNVCGTLYPKEDNIKPNQKCIVCGKKANHIVYIAKSY
ncbi:MAG: proline--tRNA ligase [Nanoarchaeota archaeon]|nr:proline--tRNA ligase [Nanoarchaeota archaeon]MCG2718130.1 proline--tRNA ligase [Nanoarchaeota archaeon]